MNLVFYISEDGSEKRCGLALIEWGVALTKNLANESNRNYDVKPIFHLANLFARTDKKVGTLPICLRRIFSPANFNQPCYRILVLASCHAKKVAKWKIGLREVLSILTIFCRFKPKNACIFPIFSSFQLFQSKIIQGSKCCKEVIVPVELVFFRIFCV